MPKKNKKPIQLLKGFKDILPEHQNHWRYFMETAKPLLMSHGFERIDTPVLEYTNLYYKGTGKHTDIVEKELYSFEDKGGDKVTLRPEYTPGIARAYIEHGMLNRPQPVKLFSIGSLFRHDNPQAGRFRQFNQLNLEAIGSNSAILDAQIIVVFYRILESLGLSPAIYVNSIGCLECRPEYITKLKQYLSRANRRKELCESCKRRYARNPLRILDCKEESCRAALKEAPQIVDYLCDECKKHFMQVLEYLDDLQIKYELDVSLVRGLDYYTRTTFEIYEADSDNKSAQSALAGGGRYDGLIEIIGGRSTPAAGGAIGIERVISRLRDRQIRIPQYGKIDVFIAQLGDEARKECFRLHQKLFDGNILVGEAFSKDGLKQQLEKANQTGAKIALILGQKELMDKTIIIRDMESGIQEIVNYDKVLEQVKKRTDPNSNNVVSYKIDISQSRQKPIVKKEEENNNQALSKIKENLSNKGQPGLGQPDSEEEGAIIEELNQNNLDKLNNEDNFIIDDIEEEYDDEEDEFEDYMDEYDDRDY